MTHLKKSKRLSVLHLQRHYYVNDVVKQHCLIYNVVNLATKRIFPIHDLSILFKDQKWSKTS